MGDSGWRCHYQQKQLHQTQPQKALPIGVHRQVQISMSTSLPAWLHHSGCADADPL